MLSEILRQTQIDNFATVQVITLGGFVVTVLCTAIENCVGESLTSGTNGRSGPKNCHAWDGVFTHQFFQADLPELLQALKN